MRFIAAVAAAGALALSLASCAPPTDAGSQNGTWKPAGPIELVVPQGTGGGTDIAARVMSKALSDQLGVPVNVTNMAGADQITGVDYVRRAEADGTTLLADSAASSTLQSFSKNIPFDWKERTFIGRLTVGSHAISVPANSPYKTLDELLKAIKEDPKSFTVNWGGGTTTTDLTTVAMVTEAGAELSDLTRVPTESAGDTVEGLARGDLDVGVGGASAAFALASSGDIRVLAVTGEHKVNALPDVPTTAELKHEDLSLTFWVGLSAPPNLPENIRTRLEEALQAAAKDPKVLDQLKNIGVTADPITGKDFQDYVSKEVDSFSNLKETAEAAG